MLLLNMSATAYFQHGVRSMIGIAVALCATLGWSESAAMAVHPSQCGIYYGCVLRSTESVANRQTEPGRQESKRLISNSAAPSNNPRPDWTNRTVLTPIRPTINPARLSPNRSNPSMTMGVTRVNPIRAQQASADFVDAKSGHYFVGFQSQPNRTDYRNVRTGRQLLGVQRGQDGQDLFDPTDGRIFHGIQRKDGGFDYYDPKTGRWIFSQNTGPQ